MDGYGRRKNPMMYFLTSLKRRCEKKGSRYYDTYNIKSNKNKQMGR